MDLNTRNEDTRAIVTGGAQGIGFAIARQLAAEGCRAITLVGRSEEKGRKAVGELEQAGAEAIFISADMADADACIEAVDRARARFGTINGLVNAAATTARGTLLETTPELFDLLFHTNVRGPLLMMQRAVQGLIEDRQRGSIVNVLSMSAHGGQPHLTGYSASKAALLALTRNAANAYGRDGIRVNAVLPGWMDTPGEDIVQRKWHDAPDNWLELAEAASPMGQLVKTYELAPLVTYMISPQSGLMTGAAVDYDQNVVGTSE